MFVGIPIPDLDFDDDCQMLVSYFPSFINEFTNEELEKLINSQDLQLISGIPISCTSNSAVYKVYSNINQNNYAIKISEVKPKIKNEYQKRIKLTDSPFFVKTISYHENSTKAMIQMELCEGGDIRETKFDEKSIWKLIYDISNGLKILYENQFMHLDVSPGNILIHNNEFKLADFGTLTKVGQFSEGNEGAGPYVSPEAISFPLTPYPVNSQTDIFSFGVVLLEISTGKFAPRGGSSEYSMLRNEKIILGKSKNWKTSFSCVLQELINSMLKVNPNERPTAADIVSLSKNYCSL